MTTVDPRARTDPGAADTAPEEVVVRLRGVRKRFRRADRSGSDVLEILKARYAKGEITREQFEQLRRELAGPGA